MIFDIFKRSVPSCAYTKFCKKVFPQPLFDTHCNSCYTLRLRLHHLTLTGVLPHYHKPPFTERGFTSDKTPFYDS